MLQALRFVIQGAGGKVDSAIRKNIISLLLSMLGHDEVWPRGLAGCVLWVAALRCVRRTWCNCQLVRSRRHSQRSRCPLWFADLWLWGRRARQS